MAAFSIHALLEQKQVEDEDGIKIEDSDQNNTEFPSNLAANLFGLETTGDGKNVPMLQRFFAENFAASKFLHIFRPVMPTVQFGLHPRMQHFGLHHFLAKFQAQNVFTEQNDLKEPVRNDRIPHDGFGKSGYPSVTKKAGHPYQSRQLPSQKKPRTSFTKIQVSILERRFAAQKYLASAERAQLAAELEMEDAQVKTWFQNRRTKWRRQEAEDRDKFGIAGSKMAFLPKI